MVKILGNMTITLVFAIYGLALLPLLAPGLAIV